MFLKKKSSNIQTLGLLKKRAKFMSQIENIKESVIEKESETKNVNNKKKNKKINDDKVETPVVIPTTETVE